jgi:hypothetical protein
MNKEELLDEAYKNYCDEYWNLSSLQDKIEYGSSFYNHDTDNYTFEELTQEEFINKCKTNPEFSENWGLKIEERELSEEERLNTLTQNEQRLIYERVQSFKNVRRKKLKDFLDEQKIPTKLITITYNNETIESYE